MQLSQDWATSPKREEGLPGLWGVGAWKQGAQRWGAQWWGSLSQGSRKSGLTEVRAHGAEARRLEAACPLSGCLEWGHVLWVAEEKKATAPPLKSNALESE